MTRSTLNLIVVALSGALILPVSANEPPFRDCPGCPLMQVVSAGAFDMGYEADAGNTETDARPVRRVIIDRPFAVGVHEVTRGEFAEFVERSGYEPGEECHVYETRSWFVKNGVSWRYPGFEQGDDEPVVCITWHDARRYVEWLSERAGQPYRLPSEAEWEYIATIGGTKGALEGIGHHTANLGAVECCGPRQSGKDRWNYTAPVGSFAADEFGLHDVRGNVWEWLEDCYHESYDGAPADGSARTEGCSAADRRVVRGGSYGDPVSLLRAGYRLRAPSDSGYFTLGFRVARSLENVQQRR